MPSRLFPYAFLILSLAIINAFAVPDLRYYQDLGDISPKDQIALKEVRKFLKLHSQNARYDSRLSPSFDEFVGKEQDELRKFERSATAAAAGKEFEGTHQILQDVLSSENSNLIHAHPKRRQKHLNYPGSPLVDGFEDSDVLRGYPDPRDPRETFSFSHAYPGINRPVIPASKPRINHEYQSLRYRSHHPDQPDIREHGMKEEIFPELYRKYSSHALPTIQRYPNDEQDEEPGESEPDFTYRFDEPSNRKEESEFALRPNEPGYDLDDVRAVFKDEESKTESITNTLNEDTEPSFDDLVPLHQDSQESSHDDDDYEEEEKEEDEARSALERRADNHSPLVKAVDHKISNHIYFVAVVAGCSAAAMFILVLISLTWCRFQRGAKAAADVEYPAYGVTGPNKDTSPSGDRRLAQSAQMYHYQHQKQQIIAMESRTATARDPGSVSEAESDEENEEGDYTVYECPGLAPTGEMEVKNPLFHDDPTPATPAGQLQGQKNRSSEDQM